MNILLGELRTLLSRSWEIALPVFKILIPLTIVTEVLRIYGVVDWVSGLLDPVMALVGLPGSTGVIWAASIVLNLYAGIALLASFIPLEGLTEAQVTVLGSMMLIAHSFATEGAIAKKVGVSATFHLGFRFLSAVLYGYLLNLLFGYFGLFTNPVELSWVPEIKDLSPLEWVVFQAKTFTGFYLCVVLLVLVLDVLERTGLDAVLGFLLRPILRFMRVSETSLSLIITGMLMGLTYGGGLLIKESAEGRLKKEEASLTMAFLGICHSLLDDTILFVLLGGNLWGLLWWRIVFSVLLIRLLGEFGRINLLQMEGT